MWNFTPWLLLVDKPSLYKRCKQNFEIKVCPVFVQLYRSRHRLAYSDKIHLVEKGNSKLSKSIRKSIEDFYDTGKINRYQLTKSYKRAVSFALSNADFPPLHTVPKLHSTSINAFSDRRISNTTTVTPFSKSALPIFKNLAPEDKPVYNCYVTHHVSLNLLD